MQKFGRYIVLFLAALVELGRLSSRNSLTIIGLVTSFKQMTSPGEYQFSRNDELLQEAITAGWTLVSPITQANICPYSRAPYNCEHFQRYIWNAALPTYAPKELAADSFPPRLVVFLPGSNSTAFDDYYSGLLSSISSINRLHIIGLNHMSTPFNATIMNNLTEGYGGHLDALHESIAFGYRASMFWKVPLELSIEYRLLETLKFLNMHFPEQRWNQFYHKPEVGGTIDSNSYYYSSGSNPHSSAFVDDDGYCVDYSKIILVGHAEGAGHAGYIAHKFQVHRLVLLSGIIDCCRHTSFLKKEWATSADRIAGLYSYEETEKGNIEDNFHMLQLTRVATFDDSLQFYRNLGLYRSILQTSQECIQAFGVSGSLQRSTAVNSCVPMANAIAMHPETGPREIEWYSYWNLWQYLVAPELSTEGK